MSSLRLVRRDVEPLVSPLVPIWFQNQTQNVISVELRDPTVVRGADRPGLACGPFASAQKWQRRWLYGWLRAINTTPTNSFIASKHSLIHIQHKS
jgi:hypothetical protein